MTVALHLARDREPLGLWLHDATIAAPPGARAQGFEYASRGDRVPGLWLRPAAGAGPHALVLVQHGFGESAAGVLDALCAGSLPPDTAVAAIDLPLHGARADQKLLGMLDSRDPRCAGLADEFVQQAVIDLERALDALAEQPGIDAQRIGFVGSGLGAQIGAAFCALDPRPAAVVLAAGVGATIAAAPDLDRSLARITPRPVLRITGAPSASTAAIWEFLARNLARRS